jgi:hypothetical protein
MTGTCSTCGEPTIYWSPETAWMHRNPELDTHPVKHGMLTDPLLISKLAEQRRAAAVIEEAKPIIVYTPEVTARDATDDEIPGGCKIVRNAGTRNGWTVHSLHYARGPIYHGTSGDFLRMIDSVVLRMDKPGYGRVVATWEDGNFYTAYRLYPFLKKVDSKTLRTILKDATDNTED